jgi:hypothetical protein
MGDALAKNLRRGGHLDMPGGGQVVVEGGYAYVGHMKPPMAPASSTCATRQGRGGSRAPGAHQFQERVADHRLYCTWFSGGLRVLDISDPTAPEEIGWYIPEPVRPQGAAEQRRLCRPARPRLPHRPRQRVRHSVTPAVGRRRGARRTYEPRAAGIACERLTSGTPLGRQERSARDECCPGRHTGTVVAPTSGSLTSRKRPPHTQN